MAKYGTMQLSNELRIQNSYRCCHHHPSIMGKSQLHMGGSGLSSQSLRQDSWTFHVLSNIRRPVSPVSSRCSIFICQSLLTPGGSESPILKYTAAILTRSYESLCALSGSPLLTQLVPAVGTMAFAAWGLGPLIRVARAIFLRVQNISETSWKKSSTHHIVTSYLQPFLLWTGATLVCRALDPVVLPTAASQAVKQRLLNFVRSLSTVLAFAYCLSSLIQQAQTFLMETNDPGDARNMGFSFAGKAVYTAVWVAAASLFMELLGFSTQRWLTAGGLGTVLLTLAGREIFTNFLSSVMIHATRPFVLGEWIKTNIQGYEVSGTVEHVGWWSPTIIRADDREAVHIPNHKFTVSIVRNLTRRTHWRIKTHLAISHLDVNKINNIVADMRKVLAKNPQVEQQKLHRRVFLESVNPENQALMILVSCFVKTSHFEEHLCVKEEIILDLLRVISHHRARLAVPIRTVQKIFNEPDLDNIPFTETDINSKAAYNRPLLLIEPSYKINSDGKTKAPARPVTASVEEAADSITDSGTDNKAGSTSDLEIKKDNMGAASLIPNSIENQKSSVASASNTQVAAGPTGNTSETQKESKKEDIGDGRTEGAVPSSANKTPGRVTPETPSSVTGSGSENTSVQPNVSQTTQDDTKPLASPSKGSSHLEDNIVLGVALDGSKRTLPIEDEIVPSSAESKDLAARRNSPGSAFVSNDKKDGQMP